MAKKAKKNLKLRKQIRKTMGTICLITAIVVAAIPVPGGVEADAGTTAVEGEKYTWENQIWKADLTASSSKNSSSIPVVDKNCTDIYTTGDGTFQFAYVNESNSSNNKIAVILGYNGRNLVDNYLEIPDEVDAYTKYNSNQGSFEGYVAVSKSQKPLFYAVYVDTPKVDATGNEMKDPVTGEVLTERTLSEYRPCYYNDRNSWQELDLTKFYYWEDANGDGIKDMDEYKETVTDNEQWIKNIKVFYIGNQTLIAKDSTASGAVQGWEIAEDAGKINTDPLKGIFANNTNIKTLVIGEYLKGIGNWAFYTCGGLDTVTLGNGVEEIGSYAFADCINLKTVNIPFLSNITFISDYAFQNCQALTKFTLPASVQYIYDHAFDGCWALSDLDIAGLSQGANVNLKDLGYYVFKGCTSLQRITIPASFVGEAGTKYEYCFALNNFKDCSNLRSITIQTAPSALRSYIEPVATTGKNGDNYTTDMFKNEVHETFYFECVEDSKAHEFASKNAIAFKYANEDKYEKKEIVNESTGASVLFQVNSQNQLLLFEMEGKVPEVTIPSTIGPYGISEINAGSFSNNCYLEKVTIPGTITAINEDAFKGCHNLKHVIFEDAARITKIGSGAFATQVVSSAHALDSNTKCDNKNFMQPDSSGNVKEPMLTFSGEVGSDIVPFRYAMSADGNINAGAQPKTYITYYSGWPTNLEIRYNPDNGRAEVVDYPTFEELSRYTQDSYPYMTQEYLDAAKQALTKYNLWLTDKSTQVTQNQWSIINAALNVVLPEGITGIASGLFNSDKNIESVTMESVKEIKAYSFSGCKSLTNITITGGAEIIHDYAFASKDGETSKLTTFRMTAGGETIGDYAFQNNENLTSVLISPQVTAMGLRPFKECTALEDVSFGGGPYFTCEDSIIYGKTDGVKTSVVQCLETRSKTINAKEMTGVKELKEEAFMDCEKVGSVDLSMSYIERIPKHSFANTTSLFQIVLPATCKSISEEAFKDSAVQYAEIPGSVTFIDPSAFDTYTEAQKNDPDFKQIEFYCEPDSAAETYANEYYNIIISEKEVEKYFTVTFWDYATASGAPSDTLAIVKEQTLLWHTSATAPDPVGRDGYRFSGWSLDYSDVSRDMDIYALYEKIDSEETKYTVTFVDWDDTVLYTQTVYPGKDAITPQNPTRTDYTFIGWRPAITNVQSDITTYAQYEYGKWVDSDGDGVPDKPDNSGSGSTDGSGSGSGNDNNSGSNNGSNNGNNSGNNNGTTNTKFYTLTVKNGSGSGSYAAGAQVPVIANEPATGQKFDKWVTENSAATFVSSSVAATFLIMPEGNVTIEATYKVDPNYTGNSGSSSGGSNGTTNVPGSTTKPGTIIVIDKNGLSNTGVVSGTVYGSSDNFVIKISEDKDATEEVLKALLNEYGTVENLKYFPMDISLYDSTGKTKITDTSGLSIQITLPLPDSMIKYAGNNKVASVVNERLDKLSARFSTIDGVPCVTFTAEHFSPYVIYVDVSDLSSSGTVDSSPKTGDIHPKWFFVMGLGCMAMFLFLKKDKNEKYIGA